MKLKTLDKFLPGCKRGKKLAIPPEGIGTGSCDCSEGGTLEGQVDENMDWVLASIKNSTPHFDQFEDPSPPKAGPPGTLNSSIEVPLSDCGVLPFLSSDCSAFCK